MHEMVDPMQTRNDILIKLKQIKPDLVRQFRVNAIGLFGSYARGEQTEASDVDVLVDVDPTIGLGFVDLADRIEMALGVKTDVVPADAVKSRYRPYVTKDLIYV